MCDSERVEFGIIELMTFVRLYGCKRKIKLYISECMKRGKRGIGIRF
jgi:hypothetical protein